MDSLSEKQIDSLRRLLKELVGLPKETAWVEFKQNWDKPEDIGEYISALSNAAALHQRAKAYMVWGVADETHEITGTSFTPESEKKGNEELENWLLRLLSPRIDFTFNTLDVDGKYVVILEIDRAAHNPVSFSGAEYIRVGSYKKKLKEFPEKERALWRVFDTTPYEELRAAEDLSEGDILKLIDYPAYFDLIGIPLPDNRKGILDRLEKEDILLKEGGTWHIKNLGGLLFAKNIEEFKSLKRKALRVILYKDKTRLETIREQVGGKGYASGFEGLIQFVNSMLPRNEVLGAALRKDVPMYPEIAVRELVANAIIHQDLHIRGTGPMIEIFSDRMEITNPGIPLVDPARFLGSPPHSRNEAMASLMRRVGICEERGSGIEKVVQATEEYQLPAPLFSVTEKHTRVVLFGARPFGDMSIEDKIRACYLHSCLKYKQHEFMTNASLRERFGIDNKNSAIISRVIKQTLEDGVIKIVDENVGTKARKYVPHWA